MNKQLPEQFYSLMEELQSIDFVLLELSLYLDTHPGDYEAIQQFNHYVTKKHQVTKQLEPIYGPLQQYGNSYAGYPWNWNESPWPWQI
ncbi:MULTISPECIES: spore coat protein CotJB [Bacillaceae]|uniref:spore coat protein CotJB n=1 Tax=Bacillaceae TaxID=186817 RepID=UPI001BDEB453|nr:MULTISPECIES: spore coat protein CotJB [Bacillaceae]MDX8359847.1 spore coat protein CotJB [Cytobacillus sp. IB215316]MDX8364819.1 spore coat protein CotJB [Cytobacillus sp. IB215665]